METKDVPDDFIQIKATGSEMRSRITALMECKRRQADRRNQLDFFEMNRKHHQCARVDAQVNRRKGETSHLQVRFASNLWGPQTTHAVDLNPVVKESAIQATNQTSIHQNEKSTSVLSSSSSSAAAAAAAAAAAPAATAATVLAAEMGETSSAQYNPSLNQANHMWKTRSYLVTKGKKKAASLDDIESEIEKLKKKMKR